MTKTNIRVKLFEKNEPNKQVKNAPVRNARKKKDATG